MEGCITPYGKRKLSDSTRRAIYDTLLEINAAGKLTHGSYKKVAGMFKCHWKTVSRVWHRGHDSLRQGSAVADKHSAADIERAVRAVPLLARQTMRTMAAQSGYSKTTLVHHMDEEKTLKPKASHSKPYLTDANKRCRMEHA
ncbi:hypothetical protein DYB35_007833, partial [Aphanomyces astaci]